MMAGVLPLVLLAVQLPVDEIVVSGRRLADPQAREAFAVTRLSAGEIAASPAMRIDDILGQVPGVSLFRRASSLAANPTTQGISLRGIGPNGAGRALVLLDGVPLNDPFGGQVFWSALDPATIAGADILRGSGAGPFGNQALTGVIRLESRVPQEFELRADARRGNLDTTALALGLGDRTGATSWSLAGQYAESDGFHLRSKAQRGAVDVPAASDVASVNARVETALDARTSLSARLSWFEEDRNNGTRLTGNGTDSIDGALRLVHDGGRDSPGFELAAFFTERDFASRFTAVADDRASEQPVLDQFSVPSRGFGAIALLRLPLRADDTLEFGADIRRLEGKTNELFRNLGAGFTRLREAGGDQWLVGAWVDYARAVNEQVDVTASLRLDWWRVFNGVLRERDLADGALTRDDPIAARDGLLANGRLGAVWRMTGAVRLRLAGYSGFRLPTINEFFRPFRVGNDITEANAGLDPERLYGIEAGVLWAPLNSVRVSIDGFRNWLSDGVGNVTLALGPGNFPPTGFVPAGGSLRQRQNIGRIVADGVESEARLTLAGNLDLVARYLFVRSRVVKSPDAPEIEGKRVAQSPKHALALGLDWRPAPRWQVTLDARWQARRYEDDLESRVLDDVFTLDSAVFFDVSDTIRLFLAAENLFDATVESQIDGAGLISRGDPRLVSGGVRMRY